MNSVITDTRRPTALRRTGLLDTPPSATFDRLTALATRLLGVPVALVSLVDVDRQLFVSCRIVDDLLDIERSEGGVATLDRHMVSADTLIRDARDAVTGAAEAAHVEVGTIWAENNDGPGSTFYVAVPDRT